MDIQLIRNHRSRWALDGELRIMGQKICDTSENLQHHLAPGTYPVLIERCPHYRRKMPIVMISTEPMLAKCHFCKKVLIDSQHANLPCYCPQIKIGNGVANRTDGTIIIGDHYLSGVMINSSEHFNRLIDRLDKAAQRDEPITLTIQ